MEGKKEYRSIEAIIINTWATKNSFPPLWKLHKLERQNLRFALIQFVTNVVEFFSSSQFLFLSSPQSPPKNIPITFADSLYNQTCPTSFSKHNNTTTSYLSKPFSFLAFHGFTFNCCSWYGARCVEAKPVSYEAMFCQVIKFIRQAM